MTTQLVYQVLITIPAASCCWSSYASSSASRRSARSCPSDRHRVPGNALINGLILFTMLVALGLAMRFCGEVATIARAAPCAVVLMLIVICMAVIAQVFNSANMRMGLSISLFPMVISCDHRTHVDHVENTPPKRPSRRVSVPSSSPAFPIW
ncbi:MAG: 7TM domain-containing protein [Hyphomonas sp.]